MVPASNLAPISVFAGRTLICESITTRVRGASKESTCCYRSAFESDTVFFLLHLRDLVTSDVIASGPVALFAGCQRYADIF